MNSMSMLLVCVAQADAIPTNTMWVVTNPPAKDSGVKAAFTKRNIPYPSEPLKQNEVWVLPSTDGH